MISTPLGWMLMTTKPRSGNSRIGWASGFRQKASTKWFAWLRIVGEVVYCYYNEYGAKEVWQCGSSPGK